MAKHLKEMGAKGGSGVFSTPSIQDEVDDATSTSDLLRIDTSGLKELNCRPSLVRYVRDLHDWRHFIFADARSKALNSGRGMFLGRAWLVLQPLFDVSVYAVIFGLILHVSRGIENYIGYLVIGVVFFRYISRGISSGAGLVQSSRSLIASFTFPRAAVVFSAVIRQFLDNLIPLVVALTLAFAYQFPAGPSWTLVLLPPLYVLVHVFILGLMLFISRVTAFIPDIKPLIGLFNRALFFTSGIFYSLERFDGHPVMAAIMQGNPVYQFLTAARDITIYGVVPPSTTVLALLAWTATLFLLGLIYFWNAEERYATVG
ncbi:ABC transporter permease [Corynebacterium sp. Marseille-P8863]|uniref:ABC transporter permease n=1 Tax=Corynebacterium sp. Marseille-P8863 TaxID=2866576 RepID=UPI0022644766|nr:ABC transporter permease [Corynebacterium sp. Marseille-P8863]